MPAVGLSQDDFNRVFGPKDELDSSGPGKSRKCKMCGGWHRLDQPWPHNCRPEAPRRNPNLHTPQLAPKFEAFRTGVLEGSEIINDRADKREYMKRNDLVEYDEGVTNEPSWVEQIEYEREIVDDLKRFHEIDSENLSPDLKAQDMDDGGSLDDGTEINATDIEVVK